MPAAQQVYSRPFDRAFFALSPEVQARIEARIDAMGRRLAEYPHYRMAGSNRCRLRIGDYRVIYRCDLEKNEIELLYVGHRRDVYHDL